MEKYVAYVGTYTHRNSHGIHIYDIDPATWKMSERKVIPINNPSDMVISADGRFLYSIADEGVRSFLIQPDGDLLPLNSAWTGAMRGNDLEITADGKYLFVAGYHDGSVTLLEVNEDGTVGAVLDNVFHENASKGLTRARSAPHVTCVRRTPDQKGVAAVDSGLDHVKIYHINRETGKLKLHGTLRAEIDSSPILLRYSADGRFAYLLCEGHSDVTVYSVGMDAAGCNTYEEIQEIPTSKETDSRNVAACSMEMTMGGKHLLVGNNGVNSLMIFTRDEETGMLTPVCENRASGAHPKALGLMPDNRQIEVLMHETNEIISLHVDYDQGYFLMNAKPLKVEQPNCIRIHRLPGFDGR